jgi:hypothetical protein
MTTKRKLKNGKNGRKKAKCLIDLTGDDDSTITVTSFSISHSFFNKAVPQTKIVEEAFMTMIKQFVAVTADVLTANVMSHMILAIAKDESLQKDYYLNLRISLCETASALGIDDIAENFLKELRLAHKKTLFSSDVFRAAVELRKESLHDQMYEYIDYDLTIAVCDKLRSFETYGEFLEDFYSDFITELNVTSLQFLQPILAKSAYLVGKAFLNNTIPASEIDTNAAGNIFMNFAVEYQNPSAIEWKEKQKFLLARP